MLKYDVIIIGSGAAGYSTADWLSRYNIGKIAVLTENINYGTSRNAGSDKQTYYKLSLSGNDSVESMAKALCAQGGMHGDTAFIEAVNSVKCFMRLVDYGVNFPTDKWGRYVGYKTDHDDAARGSSVGPLTSKIMTDALEKKVMQSDDITVIDNATAIRIITENNCAIGVIYLTKKNGGYEFIPIMADNVILATGGAAGVYADSVYPTSQSGAMGLAIDAGCTLNNITEWQYGIASTEVKWNLSGSYQQVIPTYYSIDKKGQKREFLHNGSIDNSGQKEDFLHNSFNSTMDAMNAVFLKGYQWPFDSEKIAYSSKVDIAVGEEVNKGREVFIDFRVNPTGYDFNALSDEAKSYLIGANAVAETPYERLLLLNPKAIEFFKSKGFDLSKKPLKIAVCAQHINGGVDVDINWETSVNNLFAVGEVAGTFGIYRPGGSALNSTQVGGLRIAQYLAKKKKETVFNMKTIFDNSLQLESDKKEKITVNNVENTLSNTLQKKNDIKEKMPVSNSEAILDIAVQHEYDYVKACILEGAPQTDFAKSMNEFAAYCRNLEQIVDLEKKIDTHLKIDKYLPKSNDYNGIVGLYKYRDNLSMQSTLCKTLVQIIPLVGSRGGAISFMAGRLVAENKEYRNKAIVTEKGKVRYVELRKFPDTAYNFEQVWGEYLKESNENE